jgi:hypothetical protein
MDPFCQSLQCRVSTWHLEDERGVFPRRCCVPPNLQSPWSLQSPVRISLQQVLSVVEVHLPSLLLLFLLQVSIALRQLLLPI